LTRSTSNALASVALSDAVFRRVPDEIAMRIRSCSQELPQTRDALDAGEAHCRRSTGTGFFVAAVVGSGIAVERLAGVNVAVRPLANTVATGAAMVALILTSGPFRAYTSTSDDRPDAVKPGIP